MIDLRRLLLLRELHARRTVAAVAEALAYSPSAVSQGLAALQREAGVRLTERVGRRLQLTEAGLRLVEHADALLERLEVAEAELQAAAGVVAGRVRVGALQTPLLSLVPPAIIALGERHPGLRVELQELEPEVSLPAVALGELEVAVAEEYDQAPRAIPRGLRREQLCRDPVRVVLPADHPLARGGAGLTELGLERLEVRADRVGKAVAELREVLAHLGELGLERLGVDPEQLAQRIRLQVETVDVQRALGGHEADGRLGGLGVAVATAEDPLEDA